MKSKVLVGFLIALYGSVFSWLTCLAFLNFHAHAYDIGIHIQAIWMLAHGEGIFNTVRGMNIFGDHLWLINFLIAPIYRIFDSPLVLLVLQSFILGLGAWPLFKFALEKTRNNFFSIVISTCWLLSPALQNMNLEQFHPEVFATTFLMFAIDTAFRKKWSQYWIWIILALVCKEDVAITVSALGIYLFFESKERERGICTSLIGISWFIICLKVLLPLFNGEGFFRFSGGYWFSNFWAGKLDPQFYLSAFWNSTVLNYLIALVVPLALLPFFGWKILMVAVPAIFINIVSKNDYLISVHYHYVYSILAPLFAAAVVGFSKIPKRKWAIGVTILTLVLSIGANHKLSGRPLVRLPGSISDLQQYLNVHNSREAFEEMQKLIPESDSVSASYDLVPQLAHRNFIYMFPNPFQISYWGMNGENQHDPLTVKWILVTEEIVRMNEHQFAGQTMDSDFELRASKGRLLLFERKKGP